MDQGFAELLDFWVERAGFEVIFFFLGRQDGFGVLFLFFGVGEFSSSSSILPLGGGGGGGIERADFEVVFFWVDGIGLGCCSSFGMGECCFCFLSFFLRLFVGEEAWVWGHSWYFLWVMFFFFGVGRVGSGEGRKSSKGRDYETIHHTRNSADRDATK